MFGAIMPPTDPAAAAAEQRQDGEADDRHHHRRLLLRLRLRVSESAIVVQTSERREQVDGLLAARRLLHFHQTAAAAVGDAGFGDLVVGDLVLGGDVLRTHDTGDVQDAEFLVQADFLRAADMTRLPFSRMPVTTAATIRVSLSVRSILPLPSVLVSEP
jgi:hypothetical protein